MKMNFVGASYKSNILPLSCQTTINYFVENSEGQGKYPAFLRPTSGTALFSDLSTINSQSTRGMYYTSLGQAFYIAGTVLYEFFADGSYTKRGTLSSVTGIVNFADNGYQMIMVDGVSGYILNIVEQSDANGIVTDPLYDFYKITDPNFPVGATFVCFQNDYFLVNGEITNSKTGQVTNTIVALSALLDGSTWTDLTGQPTFFQSQNSGDPITAIINTNAYIWVFGSQSLQAWYNDGTTPYSPIGGTFSSIGILAPYSLAKLNDVIFFLGASKDGFGQVYQSTSGYTMQKISTYPIEEEISSYKNPEDAIAFTFSENGHYFYVLNFQADNKCWVYDNSEGAWHERTSRNIVSGLPQAWKYLMSCFAFNKNFVGSINKAQIFHLDSNTCLDNGQVVMRERTAAIIYDDNMLNFMFYKSFTLDVNSGVGLTTGQGSDPQIMMQYSKDGGRTWSYERWTSLGKLGNYKHRVKWYQLGIARSMIFRIRISDPVNCAILGAVVDATVGLV